MLVFISFICYLINMKKIIDKVLSNKIVKVGIDFFSLASKNGISQLSVQGAYYVFASLVPFLILLLTMLRYTPLDFEFATKMILEGVPVYFQGFAKDIVKQIYNNSNFAMSFSVIILLWTASKGIYVIIDGFNIINKTQKKTSYFKDLVFSLLYTLIFILAIPVLVIVTIFGQTIIGTLVDFIPLINKFQFVIFITRILGSTMIIFLLLFVMYKFLPTIKMKVKDILLGTLIATISWQIFSYMFSIYVDISLQKASLYGSMSIILILLFWLYCVYFIIFTGAQINYMVYNKNHKEN